MSSQELQGKGPSLGNLGRTGGSNQKGNNPRRYRGKKGRGKDRWIKKKALLHKGGSRSGEKKLGKDKKQGLKVTKVKKKSQQETKLQKEQKVFNDNLLNEKQFLKDKDNTLHENVEGSKIKDSNSLKEVSDISSKEVVSKVDIMESVLQNGDEKNKLLEVMSRHFNSASIPEGSVPLDIKKNPRVSRLTRKRKSEVLDAVEKTPDIPVIQQTSTLSSPVATVPLSTSSLKKVRKECVETTPLSRTTPNTTPNVTPNTIPNATPSSGRKRRSVQEKKSGCEKDSGEEATSEAVEIDSKTEESSSNEKGIQRSRSTKRGKGKGKSLAEDGEGNDSGTESPITPTKGRGRARSSSEEDSLTLAELAAAYGSSRGRGKGRGIAENEVSISVGRGKGKGKGAIKDDFGTDIKGRGKQKVEGEKMDDSLSVTPSPGSGRIRGKGKIANEEGGNSAPSSSPSIIFGKRSRGKVEVDKEGTLEIEAAGRQRRSMTPITGDTTPQSEPKRSQRLSLSRDSSHDSSIPNKKGKQKTTSEMLKRQENVIITKTSTIKGKKDDDSLFTKTGKKKKKHFKGLSYSFSTKKKKGKCKIGQGKSSFDNSQETDSVVSEEIDIESVDSSSQDVPSEQLSYQEQDGMDDGFSEAADNEDIEMDNLETQDVDVEGDDENMEYSNLGDLTKPVKDKTNIDETDAADTIPAKEELSNRDKLSGEKNDIDVSESEADATVQNEYHKHINKSSDRYEDTDDKALVKHTPVDKATVLAICKNSNKQTSDTEEDIASKDAALSKLATNKTICNTFSEDDANVDSFERASDSKALASSEISGKVLNSKTEVVNVTVEASQSVSSVHTELAGETIQEIKDKATEKDLLCSSQLFSCVLSDTANSSLEIEKSVTSQLSNNKNDTTDLGLELEKSAISECSNMPSDNVDPGLELVQSATILLNEISDSRSELEQLAISQVSSNVLSNTADSVLELENSATPGTEDVLPEEGATLVVEEKGCEKKSEQQSFSDYQLTSAKSVSSVDDEVESATNPPSHNVTSEMGVNSSQEDIGKTNLLKHNKEPVSSNDQSLHHVGKRRYSVSKRKLDEIGVEGHNSDSSDSLGEARPAGEGVRKSKRLSRNGSPHPLAVSAPRSPEGAGTGQNQLKPIGTQSAYVTPVSPEERQRYILSPPLTLTQSCHQQGIVHSATPSLTNVLCKCRVRENPTAVGITGDVYCQAIDSFDGRMIGCCNVAATHKYLRVSGKIPFMLLCEIHRQRLRRHNCCPCCGLFCTQGVFYECSWDKSGLYHYYHKLCGLMLAGATLCPHCGSEGPPREVQLDLKLNRKPVVYLKQHQERKEASARMTWSKRISPETVVPTESMPENEPTLELCNGRMISSHRFPLELGREKLQEAIKSIHGGKNISAKPSPKGMYSSCKQNDLEKLLHVLVHGVNPNVKVKEYGNQTGMHVAAAYGSLEAMHVLVLAGATVDMTDTQLMTPLMIAITKDQNSVVHYLIQAGASLMAKTQDGMTCLHLAAKCGNLIACQHILDSGRLTRHAVNMQDEGGWTPLVWASENRFISVVKFLLDRGGNPQLCDVEQNTALHWAAFSGSTHICSMVLDRGCSLRSMNAHGDTPLHIAARQNHIDAVVLLLARGARLDVLNTKGQTPIDCALPDSDVYLQLSLNNNLIEMMHQNNIRTEKILSSDIAAGKEEVPIPCVNGIDDENLPKDYLYIAENCEASNVIIDRTITSLKWCECEDVCNADHCGCGQLNFQCWYDPDGRLLPEFNYADPPMIFECNRACRCNKLSCNNRVVQHGISAHMQLFKTAEKGWGVRALKTIQKGSYVCEYVGEIITDLEADQRQDDSYLFDLDNKDSETFCIDARGYGNIARFINHLCEANLTPVKVFIDHQDLTFPRIAFFANRDIEADEELGFDYGEKFWIIKYKHFTCTCSSDKCKYSSTTIHTTLENYNKRIRELHEVT
ncbi:uncharacterized protein G9a isoform X3 [Cherax quadricarinatus]